MIVFRGILAMYPRNERYPPSRPMSYAFGNIRNRDSPRLPQFSYLYK